jgi:hypothetical protein
VTLQATFNGKIFTVPGSSTAINTTALNNTQLGYSGIVAIIGSCTSGQPKTVQSFNSAGQLVKALGAGQAYDGARMAFNPSSMLVEGNYVQPQLVYVVRADSANQSAYTALDAATNPSITLTSIDYGVQTNSISVAITSGTFPTLSPAVVVNTGILPKTIVITNSYNNALETYTNIGQTILFSLQYTGSGSAATVTVNATGITTTCTGDTPSNLNILFATYSTIAQITSYIEGLNLPYTVSNIGANASTFLGSALDYFSAQDVKTALVGFPAVTTTIVSTINGVSGQVTAALATSSSQRPPAVVSANFTGGGTTAPTNSDYIAALSALSTTRVNFVACAADADTPNLGAVFTSFVENMQGVNECRAHLGMSANQTLTTCAAYAASLNSNRTCLWFQQVTLPNNAGVTTTYNAWMLACMAAGFQAGTPVGTSFVQKSFSILGATQNSTLDVINNTTNIILDRLAFVSYVDATKSWNVIRCLSVYFSDTNDANLECGISSALDFAVYSLRTDIQTKFGGARTLYTAAGSTADSIQRELISYGALLEAANVITKGTMVQNNQTVTLPALVVDSVSINADIARLRFAIRPIGALNFIFQTVTVNAQQQTATT